MSDQAITFLRTLNSIVYSLSLSEALSILDAAALINPVVFDWNKSTLAERVAEARNIPAVMANLPDRKIQAIKEVRSVSGLGLVDSKAIIDQIQPPPSNPCSDCNSYSGQHYSWCSRY